MRWSRSTPTTPDLVVSTVWQAAKAAIERIVTATVARMASSQCTGRSQSRSSQPQSKKSACQRSQSGYGEGERRAAALPAPAGDHGAERRAGAVAEAGKQRLAAGLRASGKNALRRGDRGGVKR